MFLLPLPSTLDGLSSFTQLEELVLDNNELTDQAMSALPNMPTLQTLSVNKNKVNRRPFDVRYLANRVL